MKNLECSSRGDRRFSAFYARTYFFGIYTSIESHYQGIKRNIHGIPCKKGESVDHCIINNQKVDSRVLTPLYNLLWVKYFRHNPELLAYARKFDTFSDMFGGSSINRQDEVIANIVKYGLKAVSEKYIVEYNKYVK